MTRRRRAFGRTRRLVADLTGRAGRDALACVLAQIDAAIDGGELACVMASGKLPTEEARGTMSDIEHRGDAQRAELVSALRRALAMPIDREDLYRLSRSVDDVLDNLRDFVRECDLYQPETLAPMIDPLQALTDGLRCLRAAVGAVARRSPEHINQRTMEARSQASKVRILYQRRLAELFNSDEPTMDAFKARELLRRLDVVALRLREAADALNDGMLKRSL